MENSERLNLLKARTFGEVLGDTFTFIRLNLAVILKAHFLISLPIIIVTGAVFVLAFRDYFSLLHTIQTGPFIDSIATRDTMNQTMVTMLFSWLAITPVSIVTFSIVDRYYRRETGVVKFEEVWGVVRRRYLKVFAAKIIIAPIIFFPGLILILPGLAFFTLFLCVELLIIQHNFGLFKAIGRSSNIMGKNFWPANWTNLAVLVLFFAFTGLMTLPVMILETAMGLTSGIIDTDSPLSILAMSIRAFNTIAGYVLYTIPTVAIAMQYYSIREKMSRSSIMERIRAIGLEEEKKEILLEEEQY